MLFFQILGDLLLHYVLDVRVYGGDYGVAVGGAVVLALAVYQGVLLVVLAGYPPSVDAGKVVLVVELKACKAVAVVVGEAQQLAAERSKRIVAAHVLHYLKTGELLRPYRVGSLLVHELGKLYEGLVGGYGLKHSLLFHAQHLRQLCCFEPRVEVYLFLGLAVLLYAAGTHPDGVGGGADRHLSAGAVEDVSSSRGDHAVGGLLLCGALRVIIAFYDHVPAEPKRKCRKQKRYHKKDQQQPLAVFVAWFCVFCLCEQFL